MKKPVSPIRKETMKAMRSFEKSKRLPDGPFPRSSHRRPVRRKCHKDKY
ncbi:MAG: hypothetical protein PHN69_00145 [Candidatus Pacebacteria bacterium]|nr:hypothetical protein [Candidatus Paceibacterota bacterium]